MLEEDTDGLPGPDRLRDVRRADEGRLRARRRVARGERARSRAPSSADELFACQRYHGGALVLYALRQKVGARRVRADRDAPTRTASATAR